LPYNRICFSLAKGYGNAVSRNRAKRLGREAYRLMKNRLLCGYDLILSVSTDTVNHETGETRLKTPVLSDRILQLETLFSKAGLFI
jgi:ribonuclease P protein component